MPRTRSTKPEFFTDADLGALSPLHRLLYQGLWLHADKRGVLEYKPRELKIKILPYDQCDVVQMLADLTLPKQDKDYGFIRIYRAGGYHLIQIIKLDRHQHFHVDERPNKLPGPESADPVPPQVEHRATTGQAPSVNRGDTGVGPSKQEANTPGSSFLSLASDLLVLDPCLSPPKPAADSSHPVAIALPSARGTSTPSDDDDDEARTAVEALLGPARDEDDRSRDFEKWARGERSRRHPHLPPERAPAKVSEMLYAVCDKRGFGLEFVRAAFLEFLAEPRGKRYALKGGPDLALFCSENVYLPRVFTAADNGLKAAAR